MEVSSPALLHAAARLQTLTSDLPPLMLAMTDEEFNARPAPGKWSKKEILGHLIDSASNNHQRFVRIQYQHEPYVVYHQNEWVNIQDYQGEPRELVISLWQAYNRHIAHIITRIPEERYERTGNTGKEEKNIVTLKWLVEDYLAHMEHHLKAIVPGYFS
jgi:hypothetical protein